MDYKQLTLLVCAVKTVQGYFKEGSPAYNCLKAAMEEMVKQEYPSELKVDSAAEIPNRNIQFPPSSDSIRYC